MPTNSGAQRHGLRLVGPALLLLVSCPLSSAKGEENAASKSYPVLSGVGIALGVEGNYIFVSKILPGSPADESEAIREGMRVLAVELDGEEVSLVGKTVGEAASLIRGPVDTAIILKIAPHGKDDSKQVKLIRRPLELSGIPSSYESVIGKAVADVAMTSLADSSTIKTSAYRGKILVLDFWASWCPTCYEQVEKLQKLRENRPEWEDTVELVTVTVDANPEKAAEVIRKKNWTRTHNLVIDEGGRDALGVYAVPVLIIVAPDGTIATMAEAHAVDVEDEVLRLLRCNGVWGESPTR